METGIYVALSGQIAAQRRLETIAHNVANASTPGFRAEEVSFTSLVSQTSDGPVAFSSMGESYLSLQTGPIVQTNNPLDVAVSGDAYLALQTPEGLIYTRDGRLKVTPNGELQSITGYPVADRAGATILLNARGGTVQIDKNGTITQDNIVRGAIGLYTIEEGAKLERRDNSGFASEIPGNPVTDFSKMSLRQGFIEQSNVNSMMELSRLIQISRSFDAVANAVDQSERSLKEAIRALGGS
ncbi:MAG: flagellar basal-body rod protein FlgF [Filomicrobium sp.]